VLNGTESEARSAASLEMIQRIRELAQRLNYRPDPQATGLRTRKTRTIGVLVPRLSDLVVATIYEGIDEAAIQHRYFTFVSGTLDDQQRQAQLGETALDRNVEGLIIGDARTDNHTFINALAARGVPLVLVSRHAPGHCSVTCDDHKGGWLAAEHLLGQGHRSIAVLAGESFASTGVDRTAGFLACCAAHGVSVPAPWVIHGHFDTQSGRHAGDTLLAASVKPTAIFAVNDFLAIGLMGALRDHGIRAGDDIAVVGFNDTPLAAELPIGLSSVRSPMREMGYRSMELLLQKLGGARPESERLEPTLMVRASSQFPA